MRIGETMMCDRRAVKIVGIAPDGVRVLFLTSGKTDTVQGKDLYDATEPDAAKRYTDPLTPGRVPQ